MKPQKMNFTTEHTEKKIFKFKNSVNSVVSLAQKEFPFLLSLSDLIGQSTLQQAQGDNCHGELVEPWIPRLNRGMTENRVHRGEEIEFFMTY